MAELEDSAGAEFDRLYLEGMIQHHQGALDMVEELLEQQGSAQDPLLYEFTSDVTSDQTSEIERMDIVLASLNPDPRVGLAAGFRDAGEAALNMQVVASLPKPPGFFDPDRPSGLSARRLQEIEEELDTANGQAPETPTEDEEDEEDDEDDDIRPALLRFSNTDLLFAGKLFSGRQLSRLQYLRHQQPGRTSTYCLGGVSRWSRRRIFSGQPANHVRAGSPVGDWIVVSRGFRTRLANSA